MPWRYRLHGQNPYAAGMAVFSAAAHTVYTDDRTVLVGGQEYRLAPIRH